MPKGLTSPIGGLHEEKARFTAGGPIFASIAFPAGITLYALFGTGLGALVGGIAIGYLAVWLWLQLRVEHKNLIQDASIAVFALELLATFIYIDVTGGYVQWWVHLGLVALVLFGAYFAAPTVRAWVAWMRER